MRLNLLDRFITVNYLLESFMNERIIVGASPLINLRMGIYWMLGAMVFNVCTCFLQLLLENDSLNIRGAIAP